MTDKIQGLEDWKTAARNCVHCRPGETVVFSDPNEKGTIYASIPWEPTPIFIGTYFTKPIPGQYGTMESDWGWVYD